MIPKPHAGDYPPYMNTYIAYVEKEDTLTALRENKAKMIRLFHKLTTEQQAYRYAEGKWNAKEMLLHIIDAERVFQYRALRFARQDATDLPGFEQDTYVQNANVTHRNMDSLLNEYEAVRNSTLMLVAGFDDTVWHHTGTANGTKISVAALLTAIAGHELHHYSIYKKRYL
jgi:uncharacterized damage-inducible protein DinB